VWVFSNVGRKEVLMGFGRIGYFSRMKITCWKTLILEFGFSLGGVGLLLRREEMDI
jgi:hypothetical protein